MDNNNILLLLLLLLWTFLRMQVNTGAGGWLKLIKN